MMVSDRSGCSRNPNNRIIVLNYCEVSWGGRLSAKAIRLCKEWAMDNSSRKLSQAEIDALIANMSGGVPPQNPGAGELAAPSQPGDGVSEEKVHFSAVQMGDEGIEDTEGGDVFDFGSSGGDVLKGCDDDLGGTLAEGPPS
jgi:hypothetical protein